LTNEWRLYFFPEQAECGPRADFGECPLLRDEPPFLPTKLTCAKENEPTRRDIKEVIALRDEGLRLHEISSRLNLAQSALKRIIKKYEPELYPDHLMRLYAMKARKMLQSGLTDAQIAAGAPRKTRTW
jgi:hypothetical protein